MSELFNLSHMLMESNSPNIVNLFSNVSYLDNAVDILRSTDEHIFEETGKLYSSVLEADSRKEENVKFADFFKDYQKTINDFILKIQAMASEFSVNLETFADANNDILNGNNMSYNVMATVPYKGVEYKHLLEDIDPYKVYKKEFAFIGKLLQDLGPIGSEDQKAHIIATVCNNLSKEINDGWLDKIVEKITDCDDCGKSGYAKAIYKKFVPNPSVDMEVDIGLVKQSKLDILNYKQYIAGIVQSVTEFTSKLSKIADEVGSMFYRNQDHKLPIKTDVDGVEDRTYRLDDYSFSQMNMFMSTKISQITELCNLFMIAISIKMDCIMKYMYQCKDIIDTAVNGVDNTPNTDIDPGDTDVDNDGTPESDADTEIDMDDETDQYSISDDDTDEEPHDNIIDNSETDVEQESYLFNATVFEKERAINAYIQKYTIYESLLEAEGDTNKNVPANNNATGQSKIKNIGSFIDSIIDQLKKLVKSLTNALTVNYTPVIKSVVEQKGALEKVEIPNTWTIQSIDHKPLTDFTAPAFSAADIDSFSDKKKYLSDKYSTLIKAANVKEGTNSAKDMILATIMNSNETPYTKNEFNNSIQFITNDFKIIVENITKQTNTITNQKTAAQNAVPTNESVGFNLESTLQMYFEDNNQEMPENKSVNKQDAVKNYFRLNSEVCTAVMNINNMCMKKHLTFIRKLATIGGIKIATPDRGPDNNKDTK